MPGKSTIQMKKVGTMAAEEYEGTLSLNATDARKFRTNPEKFWREHLEKQGFKVNSVMVGFSPPIRTPEEPAGAKEAKMVILYRCRYKTIHVTSGPAESEWITVAYDCHPWARVTTALPAS